MPVFAVPAKAGPHLPTPEGWKVELAQAPPQSVNSLSMAAMWQLSQLLADQAVTSHWATEAQGSVYRSYLDTRLFCSL